MQQVSILDVNLKLVSISRAALRSHMYEVVRCLAFKNELASQGRRDPFFNLTLNAVELSIFADAELVDRAFLSDKAAAGSADYSIPTHSGAGSGIEVSEDLWVALQVEGHDEEGETSGIRLRDISAPLAAAGISILFLSTYISDFLLIKRHRLELVISILERENFMSADGDEALSAQINHSQSPDVTPVDLKQRSTVTPASSAGNGSLPSALPRSLTRSASSSVGDGRSSPARSATTSPTRPSIQHSDNESISSSLSRSRPSFGAESNPDIEVSSPTVLSPPFQSPALEGELAQEDPRYFNKLQESILSDTSNASGIVDNITLLPDEIVCVGLSMQHEQIWRTRIVHALFYTGDVLPPQSMAGTIPLNGRDADKLQASGEWDSSATSRQSHQYSTTPTPQRPSLDLESRNMPSRSLSASTQGSKSQVLFTSTAEASYPIPFLSLTLTEEGGSLITDIRLLRALFSEADESVVYAPGGGLSEMWSGEQDDDDEEDNDISINSSEAQSGMAGMSIERSGQDSRSTGREGTWDVFDDSAGWENVGREEGSDEDEQEKMLFASGRRLFKCLQLDLSSFGLEKAGLAHQFATLITKEKINLLYSATFRTANILVAKRHIRKARNALESASREQ